MKRLLRVILPALLLTVIGFSAEAQAVKPRAKVAPKPRTAVRPGAAMMKDGVMMKDGKLVMTELGMTNPVTAERTLTNGTKVSPTGLVTKPDGTTTQLVEGDMMSLTGRITTRASIMEQDSIKKTLEYDAKHKGDKKKKKK